MNQNLYDLASAKQLPEVRHAPRKAVEWKLAGELPPHHLDSEASVLSALIFEAERGERAAEAFDFVAQILEPKDFYLPANEVLADTIWALRAKGTSASIVNVANELRAREKLHAVGGTPYLAQLANAVPAPGAVLLECAKTVANLSRERRILREVLQIASEGYHDHGDSAEWAGSTVARITAAAETKGESGVASWSEAVVGAYEGVKTAAQRPEGVFGPRLGLRRLDRILGGAGPTQVTVVAATPGKGKSSLAMQAIEYIAMQFAEPPLPKDAKRPRLRYGALVFGLEMSKEELALRRTCARAGVDYQRIKEARGRLRDEDWDRLNETAPALARLPIWVEDFQPRDGQPGSPPTMAVVRAKLRRVMVEAKKQHVKIATVVFDYLQLGDPTGLTHKAASREEKVTAMSRAWKALAREFGVHVILVSQFSREVAKEERRPKMSDLRESGAIEQDANNILFIYHLNEKEVNERIADLQKQGAPVDEYEFALQMGYSLAEIIIEKQRGGVAGIAVDVAWEAKFTTFIDLGHLRRYHHGGELFEPLEEDHTTAMEDE